MNSLQEFFVKKTGKIKVHQTMEENMPFLMDPSSDHLAFTLVACTFNVAESFSETIAPWIASNTADVYSIGLQEIDMSTKNLVTNKSDCCIYWDIQFKTEFEKKGEYRKVISTQFGGMYHCLYVHKSHFNLITEAHWSKLGLGKLGFANK